MVHIDSTSADLIRALSRVCGQLLVSYWALPLEGGWWSAGMKEGRSGGTDLRSLIVQQASPGLFTRQLKFPRGRLGVPDSWVQFCPASELGQYHFHHILLAKATQKAIAALVSRETETSSSGEELHSIEDVFAILPDEGCTVFIDKSIIVPWSQ